MTAAEDALSRVVGESMEDSFRHGVGMSINVVDAAAEAVDDLLAGEILRAIAAQLRRMSAEFTLGGGE